MNYSHLTCIAFGLLVLSGCDDPYQPTFRPDYAIRVMQTEEGDRAIPPECPSWATEVTDPFDNQPPPQFGCANARNLASMVENPADLVNGRDMGDTRAVPIVGSIRRYDNNQARGLIMPANDSNAAAISTNAVTSSTMTGDVTGGTGASTSSAAAAAP